MLVIQKVEISKEEYERLSTLPREKQVDEIGEIAIKSGWHPAGYGFYGPRLEADMNENKFYAIWERGSSCD